MDEGRLSTAASNIMLASLTKLMNGGCIYIFGSERGDTSQPLARLTFGARAFYSPKDRTVKARAIGEDTKARATGHAAWFRIYNKDESITIVDGEIGPDGSDAPLTLTNLDIQEGGVVSIKECLIEMPRDDDE